MSYTYSGINVTKATSTANGNIMQETLYSYDSKHNLTSATDSQSGLKTTYTYNTKGLPLTVTVKDSTGQKATTTYTYHSDLNFLTSVTDPTGATTQYSYSGGSSIMKGLVTKVTDPNGNVTEYTYDTNSDLLLSISNPDESLGDVDTQYTYDSFRKLTGISNQDVDYGFTYDNFGRTTAVDVGANFNLTSNFYNSDGTLSSVTYGNNSTASFEYDEDNRVTAEIYDGVKTYEYDYTDEGQLSKLTDNENNVEWNYQYDMAGRVTAAHSDQDQLISYNYNNKNQLERFYVSDDYYIRSDTRYTYDDLGRVAQASFPHFTYDEPVLSYNYDSFSRLTSTESEYSIEFPGEKMVTNYSYITKNGNQTGMVESIDYIKYDAEGTATPKSNISYEYDANGNVTCVYENDVQTVKYYYDSLNRLIREDNANIDKTIVYNYDSSGDILSKVEYALTSDETLGTPTDTINYTYGDSVWKNGVTLYDGTESITYDNMGNPVSYRGYTMTWVKGKQLSTMTKGDQTLSFKYDANGIRTSKTVNGVETEYFYVGDKLLTMETNNGDLTFAYDVNGNPYAFYYADWAYYYMLNLQGDVVGIYDYTGEVVVRYTYDSWGKLISVWGADGFFDNLAVLNPLRYRGYVYDNETQLYYLQSRYYDPELCRFISADSYLVAGNALQGTNMFAYCLNNPVRYSDPSGCAPLSSTDWVAINVATIFACLIYIADYAEKHDMNVYAVADFLERTTDEDSKLVNYAEALTVGVYVLAGENWLEAILNFKGVSDDIKDIVSVVYGGLKTISTSSIVIDAGIDIALDFLNPLLFDDDVSYYALEHIMNATGGLGLTVFTLELAASATAMTGNPLAGAIIGTAFYSAIKWITKDL